MKLVTLGNMKLKCKLTISMLLAGVLPLVIASIVIDQIASSALRDQSYAQLNSMRAAKKTQVETYFQQIRNQIQTFSEDTMVINAMNGFRSAFHQWPQEIAINGSRLASMKQINDAYYSGPFTQEFIRQNQREIDVAGLQPDDPATIIAQYHYIANNPESLGSKENLNDPGDGSRYTRLHSKYHPIIKNYLKKFGYYDIFLVDPDSGHIVYSVFKELDFATSLRTGPYSKTQFARAFQLAAASQKGDAVHLVDFEHYLPSYNGAAAFISSPVFDGNRLAGVLIFQMPAGEINAIMQNHAGMGETGETILIGQDHLMRSQSRFSNEYTVLNTRYDSDGVEKALRGKTGFEVFTGHSGNQVISSYSPVNIPGLNWAVMAEKDIDEAYAAIDSLHLVIIVTVLASCLLIFVYAFFTASAATKKVKIAAKVAESIASGNFNTEITVNSTDELGEMLAAMETMQTELFGKMVAEKNEILKIKQAIDSAQVNLMICDRDLHITYANQAIVEMLIKHESELKNIWPQFDPRELPGQCIEQFYNNPAHQRVLLSDPANSPVNTEIKAGDLEFRLNAVAILDNEGRYMGNMVEWIDITEQIDAERQIEMLIDNATNGVLDNRLEAERYQGFMHQLALSINRMLDAIVIPVQEATRVLETLASGNLTTHMEGDFNGEYSVMKNAVDTSITTLLKMVTEIRLSADSITTSANEIAQGNMNLSLRTEAQASSLQQTAASLEQLTSTVQQNAEHARHADKLASRARSEAEEGGDVVKSAIDAMGDINEASQKISDIISVINEIAFQTNLLALNAAVEAARAGEQGRGFAVVAVEVRNLAKRSADAAREIKLLIDDSVQKVEEGSRLVNASGTTLDAIVESAKKVSDIIAGIATASHQQAAGITEINQAVTQMDAMTQQNAALVEQATSASLSMDEQARRLSQFMDFFTTGNANKRTAAPLDAVPVQVERRSEERPWKNQTRRATRTRPTGQTGSKKQPTDHPDDSDWEEF